MSELVVGLKGFKTKWEK